MPKGFAVRRAQARFLESCRNLSEGRAYWNQVGPVRRWVLEHLLPVPLLTLDGRGGPLYEALQWLERNCRTKPLDEGVLQTYHRLLFSGEAGRYRRHHVASIGRAEPYPPPERVPLLLKQLFRRVEQAAPDAEDGLETSLRLYQRIGWIHPFADGNGRVARLAMNHWRRRHGWSYIVFPPLNEQPALLSALRRADRGDFTELKGLAVRSFVDV